MLQQQDQDRLALLPQLWDLAWEDLVFPRVLALLSAEDLFRMRATCSQAKQASVCGGGGRGGRGRPLPDGTFKLRSVAKFSFMSL